jgi:hypothetical protein
MSITVALTGALPAVVIASAALTALVSAFLLWLYRRAVVRGMNAQAGIAATPARPVSTPTGVRSATSPVLMTIDSTSQRETASPGASAYRRAMDSLNQAAGIYALGGVAYALVLTAAWMITAAGGFILTRFLWLFSCYGWPVVVAASLINPAIKKRICVCYGAIILLVAGIALVRNPNLTVGQLLYFWLFANGPGTVLLFAFLNRPMRAVGPLVLAFMVAAVTGAVVIVNIVGSSEGLMRGVVNVGSAFGLGATTLFVLLHVIGFGLFGLLGWPVLRWLGRKYQKKRMSDQSITLDALWLLFGVVQSFTLVFEGWAWIFTGLVAFATYKFTVRGGFMFLVRQGRDIVEGRMLLLLRVFSLGQRSERLFDVISKVWLRSGSISLIAGPDLVTSTVEPHEFLDFMGGRLSRQFVSDEKDLEQRVSRMDTRPDPDGRHRVNEFFCRADTWQMTMQRLARGSNAVLMDLRSFSKSNQGCIYELRQLFNSIALDRVILVIDDSTDQVFFELTVGEIWWDLEPSSPNIALSKPTVQCFSVKKQSSEDVEKLLQLLYGTQTALP